MGTNQEGVHPGGDRRSCSLAIQQPPPVALLREKEDEQQRRTTGLSERRIQPAKQGRQPARTKEAGQKQLKASVLGRGAQTSDG